MSSSNRQDEEILLLQEDERARKIANTQKVEAAVVAVELTDVSLIFAFKQYLAEFMEGLGHTIMFPIAGGASLIRAILKIREAYLAKRENRPGAILRAAVETVAALAIATAVVGTFAAAATFALVGPIIFTATLAAKTLFHLGAAIYYGIKASLTKNNDEQKQVYIQNMKTNLVIATINALTTVASGLVFIAHKASFGLLGVIGGVLGAGYAAYKAVTTQSPKPTVNASQATVSSSELCDEPPQSPSQKKDKGKVATPLVLEEVVSSSPVPNASPKQKTAAASSSVVNLSVGTTTQVMLQTAGKPSINAALDLKASIVTPAQTQTDPIKKSKAPVPEVRSEEAFLDDLKKTLKAKRELINEEMRKLEKQVGSNHAFNHRHDSSQGTMPLNLHWWDELMQNKFANQSISIKALMLRIDLLLREYNKLINNHKEMFERDNMQATLRAAHDQRVDTQKEEQRKKEFKDRTGFSMEEAIEIGHMAGLGAVNRYTF